MYVLFEYTITVKREMYSKVQIRHFQRFNKQECTQDSNCSVFAMDKVQSFYCTLASPHWPSVPFRITFEVLLLDFYLICLSPYSLPVHLELQGQQTNCSWKFPDPGSKTAENFQW